MLEKPDISESSLAEQLHDHYGIAAQRIAFLPIGNDENSALYRVDADGGPFFLKVRLGHFDEVSATLPKFLSDQGVPGIIAPMETPRRQRWVSVDRYSLVLFPFVEGRPGFGIDLSDGNWRELGLSDDNWRELGVALRALHGTTLPVEITRRLRRESYSSRWRDMVRTLLESEIRPVDEPTEKLAVFLRTQSEEIAGLVDRAAELAPLAQRAGSTFVPCHGDIHGRNVLIDSTGVLHVVDWDTALLAPKERDLMFIGAGVGGIWNDDREGALFYEGYGPANVSAAVLAYYRYDRIVEDIAVTSHEILSKDFSDADREKWARQLERQFLPGNVVEMAQVAYERLPPP
jgi:spectinomycin phosphotransferase